MTLRTLAMALSLAAGCVPSAPSESASDTDSSTDSETSADSDGPSADTDPTADTDPPTPAQVVRFVVLGDGGEGNEAQYAVASAVETVCADRGCDFALYLGDNIYESGVSSVDDPQFQEKFELPYANLNFPFWVVLGNHDYGGNGVGYGFWKTDFQVEYTDHSDKWTMPDRFYAFVEKHVQFVGLDTNAILWGVGGDQEDFADEQLTSGDHRWRIAMGHHPYVSNGNHGNAGNYDDFTGIDTISGQNVKEFMNAHICGRVDFYMCGHDHDRQWLKATCGTEFVVSGAASKTSDNLYRENPVWFEEYDSEGFLWVEIADDTFTGAFYDREGNLNYTRTLTK